MFPSILKALALAAALALPQAVGAATVYDEAVDGDASFGAPPSVSLLTGQNVILGSITFAFGAAVDTDLDSFRLVVATGQRIVSMLFSADLRPDTGSGIFNQVVWQFGAFPNEALVNLPIPASAVPLPAGALPVGAGSHVLRTSGFGGRIALGDFRIADYRVEVTVAPVPLPAGGALLAAALGLLAFVRRRA